MSATVSHPTVKCHFFLTGSTDSPLTAKASSRCQQPQPGCIASCHFSLSSGISLHFTAKTLTSVPRPTVTAHCHLAVPTANPTQSCLTGCICKGMTALTKGMTAAHVDRQQYLQSCGSTNCKPSLANHGSSWSARGPHCPHPTAWWVMRFPRWADGAKATWIRVTALAEGKKHPTAAAHSFCSLTMLSEKLHPFHKDTPGDCVKDSW